jgi:hypothetical protein
MTHVPGHRRPLTTSASLQPFPPRQLSLTLESPVLRDMDSSERTAVVARLATLLLQAAGLQTERSDHDER